MKSTHSFTFSLIITALTFTIVESIICYDDVSTGGSRTGCTACMRQVLTTGRNISTCVTTANCLSSCSAQVAVLCPNQPSSYQTCNCECCFTDYCNPTSKLIRNSGSVTDGNGGNFFRTSTTRRTSNNNHYHGELPTIPPNERNGGSNRLIQNMVELMIVLIFSTSVVLITIL